MILSRQIDFDYVSESILAAAGSTEGAQLRVGQMRYRVVVIPGMTTIRRSTLDLLKALANAGGTVILAGNPPSHIDGAPVEFREIAVKQLKH